MISNFVDSVQVQIMKPGIFSIPDSTRTVAIFVPDKLISDTSIVRYYDGRKKLVDTLISYVELSRESTRSAAQFIAGQHYFEQVINYGDSLNEIFIPLSDMKPENIFKRTNADVCIFLDYFSLSNTCFKNEYFSFFYTNPALIWSVAVNGDSLSYIYMQTDTIVERSLLVQSEKNYLQRLFRQVARTQGEYFGTKLIPYWLTVDRIYYKSNNSEMQKAQSSIRNNNWRMAAEIWNKKAKSKNHKLAAKAMYNMALACEMEGKPELGISWLTQSYSELKEKDKTHQTNCQRYINVLAQRKLEIEKLKVQVRNGTPAD